MCWLDRTQQTFTSHNWKLKKTHNYKDHFEDLIFEMHKEGKLYIGIDWSDLKEVLQGAQKLLSC